MEITENQKMHNLGKLLKTSLVKFLPLVLTRVLESLAGCHTMFLFAVFCKTDTLERNV